MFTIKDKDFEYIPIQYNIAWRCREKTYDDTLVKKEFMSELIKYCETGNFYIWDFKNINNIIDRGFTDPFDWMISNKKSIILANVEEKSAVEKAIKVEISVCGGRELFHIENQKYYAIGRMKSEGIEKDIIHKMHIDYLNEVIQERCIETKYQYLVSSGVYSNMQINLKNLFYKSDIFSYIIYLLWNQIYREKVDGIIATSKNGVAFASVLGEIIGCNVLYYNIGQMFEETYNCSPRIKEGGQYIHVYDMICLGSETKVLNALVNAQGGKVVKSVGCICLLDLEILNKKNRYSSMNNVECLVGQKELKQDYEIYFKCPKEG